ncbi:hypothetical protein B7463_g9704, partial [Scytalidium lignicola]
MSDQEREAEASDNENNPTYQSENESEVETKQPVMNGRPKGQRTMQTTRRQPPPVQQSAEQRLAAPRDERVTGNMGGRTGAIRESRIKDRPAKVGEKDSSLKIKIELDLEVEVDLYARVKGDVTIGLM